MRNWKLCSHRGLNTKAPENTLPAFDLAMDSADEIECDLWPSADGDLFVCHDRTVDRTTNGSGDILRLTSKEIRALDAGGWFSPEFEGVTIPTFEELLSRVAGKVRMNIHIKSTSNHVEKSSDTALRRARYNRLYRERKVLPSAFPPSESTITEMERSLIIPYDEAVFGEFLLILDAFNCRKDVYITGKSDVLETAYKLAPDLPRCCLEGDDNYTIVDHAIHYNCERAQFCKFYTNEDMLRRAKDRGIICNMFWSDDISEARWLFQQGVDVLLTNDCAALNLALKDDYYAAMMR